MKWAVALTAMMSIASAAHAVDAQYYEIGEVQVQEGKTVQLNPRLFASTAIGSSTCAQANPRFLLATPAAGEIAGAAGEILGDLNATGLILDQIVNLGKKVWTLVDAGKPVVNLKTDVATALPYGAKCWMDLQTWSAPTAKTYTVTYKNLYGMEVVKFSYRVIFVSGGSVDGKGAYIGYAAIEPSDVSVAWGFKFSAESSAPTIYNMGTKEAPVAGMNLQMNYKIDTILKHVESSQAYFISGKGLLQSLDAAE